MSQKKESLEALKKRCDELQQKIERLYQGTKQSEEDIKKLSMEIAHVKEDVDAGSAFLKDADTHPLLCRLKSFVLKQYGKEALEVKRKEVDKRKQKLRRLEKQRDGKRTTCQVMKTQVSSFLTQYDEMKHAYQTALAKLIPDSAFSIGTVSLETAPVLIK